MTDYVEWGNTQTLNHRKDTVGAYGNAQLSKFPIQYVHNFKLPMTPGNEQRCLLMTEQEIDGKLIHIYNVHLQNVDLPHSAEDRWAQSQVVSRILKADDIPYKILMGDFNWDAEKEISDYADKPLYQIMPLYKEAGMIDTALSLSPAPDKTYPSHHPIERLDYIFTTPNIKILNYQTISSSVSDHLPLRVEIEI
jgi:endonuclease/exonuclease/phosphatase family metal-dependent hydrolase